MDEISRIMESLASLPPALRAELGRKLTAQGGTPKKAASRGRRFAIDPRTAAECWLAGESVTTRSRAETAFCHKNNGAWRSIVVTFADGDAVRTGSYCSDDTAARGFAVRFARGRKMESIWSEQVRNYRRRCTAIKAAWSAGSSFSAPNPVYPEPPADGWRWVRLDDHSMRRTRACSVPDVVAVEFVPAREPATEVTDTAVTEVTDTAVTEVTDTAVTEVTDTAVTEDLPIAA